MPSDPHAEYLKRKAQRSKEIAESNAKARGVLKKSWDVANEPLWHGPQRWGKQASDWLTTPVSGESPAWAMTKGAAGGALEGVGNVASGITSPIGIATTALGLGSTKYAASAVPALAELAASRPAAMGIKAVSGLGAGRGALRIGEAALNEDDKSWMERMGDVGTGSLELVGGIAGAKLPLPEITAPPRVGTPATGALPTGTAMRPGPHIPSMLGDVEGIRTSTSPKLPASPVISTRMSTVEPTKMSAGAPNLPARDISPERSAFEALVPNRYKTQMTAEGLTLNLPERFTATTSTPSTPSVTSPPTTAPKTETAAVSTPTPTTAAKFDVSKYTDENLAAMAKRGNAEAVAEVSRRRAAKTDAEQAATKAAGEQAFAEGQAAGKAKAAPPKSPTPPTAPPKKSTKPAAPPQEPPAQPNLTAGHKEVLERLKRERAAQVAQPVPGQAGVTPVPEGVTVTKVAPGASGVVEKPAKVKAPKVKGEIPLPDKSPIAPKAVDKWALIEKDLRDQGISEPQIAELITKGKSGEIESAPVEEILAAHKAKAEAPPKAPKVKVDPKRAATLRAEANAAAEIPKPKELEGIPEKRPSNERPLAFAKDETIEARAKGGDALAAQELKWRQAEAGSSFMDSMKATVEGAKAKVKKAVGEETGAVGPGTGKLVREQEADQAWRAGQREMGFSDDEISNAIEAARKAGVDHTRSDDLYDLEEYMNGFDPFGNKGEQSVGRGVKAGPTFEEAAQIRAEGAEGNRRIIEQRRREYEARKAEELGQVEASGAVPDSGVSPAEEQGTTRAPQSAWERMLGNETGAAGPGTGRLIREQAANRGGGAPLSGAKKYAQDAFDAVNQARMASMLSGLALPKSLLGNLGSHFTAAAENRSMAPIKALGNLSAIGKDLKTGWQASENPALGGGLSRFNLPGRMMGAADHAATQSLMRSGLTEDAAREILLTSPNPVSGWKPLNSNLGKLVVPFKTTPFNQFGEGLTRFAKHPGIYAGAAGLGAGAGMLTKDPDKLGLGMGFAGPYAVPFTIGAMATAGARAAQGISPIPEWSIQKTLSEPQAAFTESPGFRWFEPGFGFGKDEAKDKTGSRPTMSRPKGRPTGRK